ncbi:MAG: GTP-dependent dephospho-CoA kinase family protein [Candidatus Hodarchaeota archaeon]
MGYNLPKKLRSSFRKPIGKLFTGNFQNSAKEARVYIKSLNPPLVMSIGDFCTKTLFDVDFFPNIVIYDNKTHKTEEVNLNLNSYHYFKTYNPPGWILTEAWDEIKTAIAFCIENNCPVRVHITGEEDLLVIPAIISLPLGSIVVYGQPKIDTEEGIVVTPITSSLKKIAQSLLDKFEYINEYEEFSNGD